MQKGLLWFFFLAIFTIIHSSDIIETSSSSLLFIQRSIEKDQLSGPILCQNYRMRFWLERGAAKHKKCIHLGINSSQKWQILLHKSLFFGHVGDILWIGTDYEIFCRKLKNVFGWIEHFCVSLPSCFYGEHIFDSAIFHY